MECSPREIALFAVGGLLMPLTQSFAGDLPVEGVPVPELQSFDNVMQAYMEGHEIDAGVLAVSVDGVVVYQRGFGVNIPENTPMRLASVEKPITSAAIRQLILDGLLDWNDFAFDLGQPGGGILPHEPWQGLGDPRLPAITIMDLMNHQGGWDRDSAPGLGSGGDPQFYTLQIAEAMGITPPAGPDDIIRYMLSEPLQFTPGMNGCTTDDGDPTFCYSNFGFMVLGRIVEEISGMSLQDYFRARVLTPAMWVPHQEVIRGRSFASLQDPREPTYQCADSCNCTNVFDPDGPGVPCPYGGWHHEAFMGHGNLVASAAPLLAYMDRYIVAVQSGAGAPVPPGVFPTGVFAGAVIGTSTMMFQRGDGINIVVLFTHWGGVEHGHNHGAQVANLISDIIDGGGVTLPTAPAVDGFWIDFEAPYSPIQVGGYDHPFRTLSQGFEIGAGAKLRVKPGSSGWTGSISHRVIIDAPFGTVTIGAE